MRPARENRKIRLAAPQVGYDRLYLASVAPHAGG
jgi:hypothetical protein